MLLIFLTISALIIFLLRKHLKKLKDMAEVLISLSGEQISNAKMIVQDLIAEGITNPFTIAGILTIVYKESGLKPQMENGYSKTSNERIRTIFSKTKTLTEDALTELKKDDVKFFNFVYGGKYGNNATTDGERYRGRGFNQITFKEAYERYGKQIGKDLLGNPALLNLPSIASKVLAKFFKDVSIQAAKKGTDISKIKNSKDGFEIALRMNHGLATNVHTPFFNSIREKYLPMIETFTKLV